MENNKRFRIVGSTDEVTACECCGRQDLKGTVILVEVDQDGNQSQEMYFGCVCAAKASGQTSKFIKSEAKAADEAKAKARASFINQFRINSAAHKELNEINGRAIMVTYKERVAMGLIKRYNEAEAAAQKAADEAGL